MKTNPTPITRSDYQDNGLLQMQNQQIKMNNQAAQKSPEQLCKEKGGVWDAVNKTCVMVRKEKSPEEILKQQVQQKGGYVNQAGEYVPTTEPKTQIDFKEDGTVAYTTKQGQTYNLTRDEYKVLQNKEGKITQNVQEIRAIEGGQLEQIRLQQIASQLGLNENQVAAIQSGLVEAPIEWGQAITEGLSKALPQAASLAAGGFAAGLTTGGAASVPLAIAGGLGGLVHGFFTGIQANIKRQQKGEIDKASVILSDAKTNMRKLAGIAAKDPQNAAFYVEAYNEQIAQVYRAQRKLQLETRGNLNKFMEDGSTDLEKFELFLAPNGLAESYRRDLELALFSGQAPSLSLEDFE